MRAQRERVQLWAVAIVSLLALAWLLVGKPTGSEAAQEGKWDLAKAETWGVSTCIECHEKPGGKPTDLVRLTEYATWRTQDRHSLAYAVLEGARGRQMSSLLGIKATEDPQCLSCHATSSRTNAETKSTPTDGVSCDGCHGPAQYWIAEHALKRNFWRALSPEEKQARGMLDVRHPVKRAEMCLSCHVGSAAEGKVVTHAMYAAGHPPLSSIEVALYSENLPRHWDDLRDVEFFKKADAKIQKQNRYDTARFEQTRLVLASNKVALRVAMQLIANRATLNVKPAIAQEPNDFWPPKWLEPVSKNEPKGRWPELAKLPENEVSRNLDERWPEIMMAQADCYACHHDLRSKSWRQERGYLGRPGRPQLQPWSQALAPLGLHDAEGEKTFATASRKLFQACDAQPFGNPGPLADAAAAVGRCAAQMRDPLGPLTEETVLDLLHRLCSLEDMDYPDYDSARQIASAFRVIYRELNLKHPGSEQVAEILRLLDDELNLTLSSASRKPFVEQRYQLMAKLPPPGKEFEDALRTPNGFLTQYQQISDRELASILERVNNYDPHLFRQRMADLGKLLPRR